MAISSASYVVNYNQLSAYQREMEPFKTSHALVDNLQALEKFHSKNSIDNIQY